MNDIRHRPYAPDDRDLPRLLERIRQQWQLAAPEPCELHPGDLLWQRYMHEDQVSRWCERVLIWEQGDRIVAFAILMPKNGEVEICVERGLAGDVTFVGELLSAMQGVLHAFDSVDGVSRPLLASAFAGSELERALLALGGRSSDDPFMSFYCRDVQPTDVFPITLPAGWMVRPVGSPAEFAGRVEAHRAAFAPSKATLAAYERLRQAPGYDPAFDVVAVGPDGTIASFALIWFDRETGTGLFEPVGSLPDYRRRGLTRAVLHYGLQQLQTVGATRAYVNSLDDNAAANALYQGVGFRKIRRWRLYEMSERDGNADRRV